MATKDLRTIPENAVILYEDVVLTRDNLGTAYITYPINYLGINTFNAVDAVDNSATAANAPHGTTDNELWDVAPWCGYLRYHRPIPVNLYDYSLGLIGSKVMQYLLKTFDHAQSRSQKVSWCLYLWFGKAPVGAAPVFGSTLPIFVGGPARDTAASDQSIVDYLTLLFGGYASTTTNDISLGSKTFTLPSGKLLTTINFLKIVSTANPANYVYGAVTAYDNSTGVTTVNVTAIGGSGTGITSWTATIASALGYTLSEHPAFVKVEVSNEQMVDSGLLKEEYARTCRIVSRLCKKFKPGIIVTGDTSDAGRKGLKDYMKASAAGTIAADGDFGTGMQACDYLDGVGFNNYLFSNGTFALHQQAIEKNLHPWQNRYVSHTVNKSQLIALTQLDTTSHWYGKDINTVQIMIGESSPLGTSSELSPTNYWNFGTATKEESFWMMVRHHLFGILATQDGAGNFGQAHIYVQDSSGRASSNGTITATNVAAHSNGKVKFTLSNDPGIPWSANQPLRRIVVTAGVGGWSDLGLLVGEKKRIEVRQISGNEVYATEFDYTAPPANNATYTEMWYDWQPYPEDIERFYNTFFNVPITVFSVESIDVSDNIISPATRRKYPGVGVYVPDLGTNTQYAGVYYIDGTLVGSRW